MKEKPLILDFGCGERKRKGTIGLDFSKDSSADVIADASQPFLPFADSMFGQIFCDDVLEHFSNLISVLKELWRIGKPGCKIFISSPHFSSYNAYQDPSHFRSFAYSTFDYFDPHSTRVRHKYHQNEFQFLVKKRKICFREFLVPDDKPPFNPWKILGLEFLINLFPKIYERFFCWIFPAAEMYYELEVIKKA